METIRKIKVNEEIKKIKNKKIEKHEEYVNDLLLYAHRVSLQYQRHGNLRKPAYHYSMGYKMTIKYNGHQTIVDTRVDYKSWKYKAYHPVIEIDVYEREFKVFEKLYFQDLRKKFKNHNENYEKIKRHFLKKKKENTDPSVCDGWGISQIYMVNGGRPNRIFYLNNYDFNEFKKYDFFQKYNVNIYYDNKNPLRCISTIIDYYIPINMEDYMSTLLQRGRLHLVLSFFEEDLRRLLKLRNEELKRKIAEHFGGFENLIKNYGQKIDEKNDGKNPIILYKSGEFKYLLCTDHSTDRQYLLCPPNQQTNDAYEAWKSTFPVAIAYRQGDVGLALLDDKGGVLDVGVIQQS